MLRKPEIGAGLMGLLARVNSDTFRIRVHGKIRFDYATWIGIFLNPEKKRCGLKNVQIRVDRAPVNAAMSF